MRKNFMNIPLRSGSNPDPVSQQKLHLIDLEIRCGVHWAALMQALACRPQNPLKYLKITALCNLSRRDLTEEFGKSLDRVAYSLNIHFTFRTVSSSLKDIKEDMFEIAAHETVVVFSDKKLRSVIPEPDSLGNLMRVIRNIGPPLMVITEVEANHNSPRFVDRFIEALFYFSVYFDCLETCFDEKLEHKATIESICSQRIRNIVAMEGEERNIRSVTLDVWREFFSRYKMVEMEFSDSSVEQAKMVLSKFPCGHLCTLLMNGKGLIFGWKGRPLFSLSVWKFSREILGRTILR